jgi:hypothetical protein
MNKVVLLSAVLIQLALAGCGNKSNNAGVIPQACGAAGGPSQYCVLAPNPNNAYGGKAMNGPQGYGYYNKSGFFVPDYQNVQTGCAPDSQPILTQGSQGTLACVPTSTFQQLGQPVYQQDYQWSQQSPGSGQNQGQYQNQNQNMNQYENQQFQGQNQQYQGQNGHQIGKTPGPAVECSATNPCQTGFCQPLQSAQAAGYCRAS